MLIWNRHKKETGKQPNKRRNMLRRIMVAFLVVSLLFGAVVTVKPKPANAIIWIPCILCTVDDVASVIIRMIGLHLVWDPIIKEDIKYLMNMEENWIVEDFYRDFWFKGIAELTEYLSAHGLYQVEMMGSFFDARNQIETSRLFFRLQAEAHRDYYPSEDFCWFGTNTRSMAASESRARTNMLALSKHGISRQLGKQSLASAGGKGGDKTGRWHQFVSTYCDPKDNGWEVFGSGLDRACDHDGDGPNATTGATSRSRVNADVDYTRLIEMPRTLDVDFSKGIGTLTNDEEDLLAMSSNLYGNQVPSRTITRKMMKKPAAPKLYLDQRTVIARRAIAQNSFNAIVAMKSAGSSDSSTGPATASYMAAIIKELMPAGTADVDIFEILGENPSYYAQLEVLSKKLYESPKFFAKLYDTPANVDRKAVAMKAIELMLDRALFESELRQEMLLSVTLSTDLDKEFRKANKEIATRGNY